MASSALRRSTGSFLILTLLLGACATPLPFEPTATPEACSAALLEGVLLRDDAAGFLVRHAEGFVTPIVWPDGYSVRDEDVLELLDPAGAVVAREGDSVSAGGGMIGNDEAFAVCGAFSVTPAD